MMILHHRHMTTSICLEFIFPVSQTPFLVNCEDPQLNPWAKLLLRRIVARACVLMRI